MGKSSTEALITRAAPTSTILGDRPAQIDAPRGEPRPEGREHEAVAVCEARLLVPLGEGNGEFSRPRYSRSDRD